MGQAPYAHCVDLGAPLDRRTCKLRKIASAGIPAQRREGRGVPVREVGGGAQYAVPAVMAGLVPAIHVLSAKRTWMPGTRPGMTNVGFGGSRLATTPSPPYL